MIHLPAMTTPQSAGPKKRKPSSPLLNKAASTNLMDDKALRLLDQMQEILCTKAPEVLPLLEEFVSNLPFLSTKIIESEKRARSVVISGIPEAETALPALVRQEHTEKYVYNILNSLDVETRPLEIYRMGKITNGKPRYVKCVLPSKFYCLDLLSKASRLRSIPDLQGVYIRKSMTPEERAKDRELRNIAREKNHKEGKRTYVVYRNEVVKVADIQANFSRFPKN